jgi:type VI secretion system secreted protein VgrG
MTLKAILENRKLKLTGPLPENQIFIRAARVKEGLSKLSEITVEFLSPDRALDLAKIVGREMTVSVQAEDDKPRPFKGTCIEAEYLGLYQGYGLYTAELRTWFWFLTQKMNNRVYQDLTAIDIIKKVFGDSGFADFAVSTSRTYEKRPYTVQYQETDFAFLSRLMEEEGLYYFSGVQGDKDKLFVVDGTGGHSAIAGRASLAFAFAEAEYRRADDHVFEWQSSEHVVPGKVTLTDYNFETPRADLKTVNALPKGNHGHKSYEIYGTPGHYRQTALGETYARIQMQERAARHKRRTGVSNMRTLATGATFTLTDHPRSAENAEYLILSATHFLQIEEDEDEAATEFPAMRPPTLPGRLVFGDENKDMYRCQFEVQPKDTPYRAERVTPWPQIPGILLAKVVGPAGEEIHTDKYGRIKVQFPWDREGKNDDKSSCFVRTVMPWTGKGWGFIAIPRIGQEVAIQFEDGDPDRPICTGMLYNADTMPPYALPANMTQSGIKTNSSKGGEGFNELMFEDKKSSELVRFQAEKDFTQIVKNNAVVTIGLEKKDSGDLTQTIHRNRTETLKTGDNTFTVEDGNETRSIAKDQSETIGKNRTKSVGDNSDLTVGKNMTETINQNRTETVAQNKDSTIGSDMSVTVGSNLSETVGASQTTTVAQSVTIEAGMDITLKVGSNSIKIDQMGVTVNGMMVTLNAKTIGKFEAGAMLVLNGKLTMIN